MCESGIELPQSLKAVDAAKYLGVSESRMWHHVREQRISPVSQDSGEWLFDRRDLDSKLKPYYKQSSAARVCAGTWYTTLGCIGLVGSYFLFRFFPEYGSLAFCAAAALVGVGLRAFWLSYMPLPKPMIEYKVFYWVFALVQGVAASGIARLVVPQGPHSDPWHYLEIAGVFAFVFGFLIHPDFWPLPNWMRSRS